MDRELFKREIILIILSIPRSTNTVGSRRMCIRHTRSTGSRFWWLWVRAGRGEGRGWQGYQLQRSPWGGGRGKQTAQSSVPGWLQDLDQLQTHPAKCLSQRSQQGHTLQTPEPVQAASEGRRHILFSVLFYGLATLPDSSNINQ